MSCVERCQLVPEHRDRKSFISSEKGRRDYESYLFNAVLDAVSRHRDFLLLAETDSSRYRLAFDAGVPLWLYKEDPVDGLKIQAWMVSVNRLMTTSKGGTYPNAPVPVVMIRIRMFVVPSKRSRISWRLGCEVVPSMRSNCIPAATRCLLIKSSVRVQHVKTMLLRR